jgi:hypothetical protein
MMTMDRKEPGLSDSSDAVRADACGKCGKPRVVFPAGRLLRGSWEAIDPLYIWSAAAGLFVALVLIAVAMVIQTGHQH